jgi:16S rRNA (uracil1498-N3)-methyltransferase
LEKATEIGIDEITPLICEHSERDIVKLPRLEKVLVSAMKQSLTAWLPKLNEPVKFKDLISGEFRDLKSGEFRDLKSGEFRDLKSGESRDLKSAEFRGQKSGESRDLISGEFRGQKFIGYCETGDESALENIYIPGKDAVILIGPEGDFSKKEVETATMAGFIPVNLGTSRLRTETAGIVACHTIELLNRMKVRDAGHETRDAGHGTRDKMTNDQ